MLLALLQEGLLQVLLALLGEKQVLLALLGEGLLQVLLALLEE